MPLLRHCRRFASFLLLVLPVSLQAAAVSPLDADELALARQQIEAMRKTSEQNVEQFVMDARMPALLERLLQTPAQWQALSASERSNALIFAGQTGSALLQVQRPSEVLSRIEQWFPEGLAAARREERLWAGNVHLYGPFTNWPVQSGVLLALWNCMPQSAWLHPQDNPFSRQHAPNGLPLYPLAARQSSTEEFDFGFCVRERNGYVSAWTETERAGVAARMQQLSEPLIPLLVELFSRTLQQQGCTGSGPDDCVLLLRQWASLRPQDPQLAQQLQRLAPEVDAGGPLPDWQGPFNSSYPKAEVGQARFDAGLRRAAFLQARLRSVLAAPQAWPQDALAVTLQQMSQLLAQQESPYTRQFSYYQIAYYNEPINPWGVLFNEYQPSATPRWGGDWLEQPRPAAQLAQVRSAVQAELQRLNSQECYLSAPLLQAGGGPELAADFVLARLRETPQALPACVGLDQDWLQTDAPAAAAVREQLLPLLPQLGGAVRESLLSGLTLNAERCFPTALAQPEGAAAPAPVPGWQQALCQQWISQPQAVDPANFPQSAGQYVVQALQPEDQSLPADWATRLPDSTPLLQSALHRELDVLQHCGQDVYGVGLWRPADGRTGPQLLELSISGGGSNATGCPALASRVLLLRNGDQLQQVQVPQRFSYQYDDGSLERVSDIDGDGQLEVWFTGTFGECDGEEEPADDSAAADASATEEAAGDVTAETAAPAEADKAESADTAGAVADAAGQAPAAGEQAAQPELDTEPADSAAAEDTPAADTAADAGDAPASASDCVSTVTHMGEVDGDALGWFHEDRQPQR